MVSFLVTSANTPLTSHINIDKDDQNGAVVLPLPTTFDADDEPNGSVTVQVLAYTSGGTVQYNVGSGNGFVAQAELIDDDVDDSSLPSVTIAPEVATISESIESRNATFRLTATSVTPPDTSTVTVSVMISQEGNFLASLDPANINRRVPVPKGGSDTFTVAIAPDNDDEPDGKIIATLVPDTTDTPVYSVGAAPAHRAEVAVTDDDETFSITATANESEGGQFE